MTIIRLRRDTSANWAASNPVLALGEPGWDTDANRMKLGDGVTPWIALPFLADGSGGGATDERLSLYNWRAENTSRLSLAIARGQAGGYSKIVFVGDSITAAVPEAPGTLFPWPDGYPYRLAASIEAAGGTIAGEGPVYPNNNAAFGDTDDRWEGLAAWDVNPDLIWLFTTSPASATFTSTKPGTVVEIVYPDTGDTWTYSIDGATPVAVNPTGSNATAIITVSGLTNTQHIVEIETATATLAFCPAVAVRQEEGLEVVSAAFGGAQTSDWLPGAGATNHEAVRGYSPDAVFIMLESNDALAGVSVATFQANLTAIVQGFQSIPADVVLMVEPPVNPAVFGDRSLYDAAIHAVGISEDVPVIDLAHHYPPWVEYQPMGWVLDDAHPTRAGHADMAGLLHEILWPTGSDPAPNLDRSTALVRGSGTGKWLLPMRGNIEAISVANYPAGWAAFSFFDIDQHYALDQAGVQVFNPGTAGSVMRVALYLDDGSGAGPGDLLADCGQIDLTVSGVRVVSFGPVILPHGRIWYTGVFQGSPTTHASVFMTPPQVPSPVVIPSPGAFFNAIPLDSSFGAGAPPSPPTIASGHNRIPIIGFRLA